MKRCWVWHGRMALEKHTPLDDIGHMMPSSLLGSTYSGTTSSKTCHTHPWAADTVGQHQASHASIAFGNNKRSDYVLHGMPSYSLDRTYVRRRSARNLRIHLGQHTRSEWHAIIDRGQHIRSYDVGCGMPSRS
uniref:Uncharacterized protein n=1 Tax=Solanum lycopersicum TaxID=4081 RepID=A0A3Q7GQT2_SOLLC